MTPDGIEDEDWDRVRDLALEIVNAGESDESEEYTAELFRYLDALESKYGPLPSITATRADYVKDPREGQALLLSAYEMALERKDPKNLVYIASSLATLNIRHLHDLDAAEKWLGELQNALKWAGDKSDISEYEELAAALHAERGKLAR